MIPLPKPQANNGVGPTLLHSEGIEYRSALSNVI